MSVAVPHPQAHAEGPHIRSNPIARAWRALFAAWDEPAPGPTIPSDPRSRGRAGVSLPSLRRDTGRDGAPAETSDLPPAPLYFACDAAETFMLRLLEESLASAADVEERELETAACAAPAVVAREAAAGRRAS